MEDFVLRALIAGICVAIVCAPLGCFVVWKKMAYFGDSLAHSSLLGIALGLLFGININLSILIVAAIFAMLLLWLQRQRLLAIDTLLGILAHAALAFGMIMISLNNTNIDIYSYLFGDILSVATEDIWMILLGGVCVLSVLAYYCSSFTLIALNEDVDTFTPRLRFVHVAPDVGTPVIDSNEVVYFMSDMTLKAIHPNNVPEWEYHIGSYADGPLTITRDGGLLVAAENGYLYSFETGSVGLNPEQWPTFQRNSRHTGRLGIDATDG